VRKCVEQVVSRFSICVVFVGLWGTPTGCRHPSGPATVAESPTSKRDAQGTAPATPGNLADAVREIAGDYTRGIKPARIETLLDVTLVPEGQELRGKSKRWPVVVHLIRPRSDTDTPLLRLAIAGDSGLTLGDVEQVFGKHGAAIRARESLVEFKGPLGIPGFRVVASVLGDANASAPVLRIEMERKTVF
jgi:hypothetical protein